MNEEKNMTRREALKKMGMVAAGTVRKRRKTRKNEGVGNQRQFTKRLQYGGYAESRIGRTEKEGCETEHIQLAGHTINPCKACFGCTGKKNCVFGNGICFRRFTER